MTKHNKIKGGFHLLAWILWYSFNSQMANGNVLLKRKVFQCRRQTS